MFEPATIGDDEFELYYQDAGEGPPIAFCHGFSGNHLSWWRQVAPFHEDYRCVVPDQRSFGRSIDPDGVGVGALADDLLGLLDHLGIEEAVLVGHSMGGWPVASVATQRPERVAGLVLSASPGGLLDPERHRELMAGAGDPPAVDPLTPELQFLDAAIGELNRDAPAEWVEARAVLDELPLDATRIADAGIPSLVIAGEADEFMPGSAVEAVADALEAESAVVEDAAHSVFYEQPAAFNRLLGDFLAKIGY